MNRMLRWVCDNDGTSIEPGASARCPTCQGQLRQVDDSWTNQTVGAGEPLVDDGTAAVMTGTYDTTPGAINKGPDPLAPPGPALSAPAASSATPVPPWFRTDGAIVVDETPGDPFINRIDLGNGHSYIKLVNPDGTMTGIIESHTRPDGVACEGAVDFARGWTVVNVDPLTIHPSVQCRRCPSHGWITDGKWINA